MYALFRVGSENLTSQFNYTCVKVLETASQAEAEQAAEAYIKENPYLIGKGQVVVAHLVKTFAADIETVKIESMALDRPLLEAPPIPADEEQDQVSFDELNRVKDEGLKVKSGQAAKKL